MHSAVVRVTGFRSLGISLHFVLVVICLVMICGPNPAIYFRIKAMNQEQGSQEQGSVPNSKINEHNALTC